MSDMIDHTTIDDAPPRRLVRTDDGRWLGGVAAGLGRYFDVNPLVYRIAFAALALAGGTGPAALPRGVARHPRRGRRRLDRSRGAARPPRASVAPRRRRPARLRRPLRALRGALLARDRQRLARGDPRRRGARLVARVAAGRPAAAPLSPSRRRLRRTSRRTKAATADAGGAASRQPKPPARPSLFAPVLGALLAAAGLFGLLAVLDIYDVDVAAALAAGVVIVGAAIAFGAMTQRRVGGLVFLGLLLLAAFALAAITPVSVGAGVGEKSEQPTTVTALDASYEHGIGELDLDLSAVDAAGRHDVGRRERRHRQARRHGAGRTSRS